MELKEQRLYSLKDEQLIIQGEVIRDRFPKYAEKFSAFNDVKFHETYHEFIKTKVSVANSTMSDAFILQTQAKETEDVIKASDELMTALEPVIFIIKSTFATEKMILREMRVKDFKQKSHNPTSFIIFTRDLQVKIEKYKEKLVLGGLKEEYLTVLDAAVVELDKQRCEQVDAIQSRPVITKDRIEKMNDLYRTLMDLRNAAKIIFKSEPEVADLFDIPRSSRHRGDEEISDGGGEDALIAE